MRHSKLAKARTTRDNRNHHLWNNNGTWFLHYTEYPTILTKQRVRRSLKTKCVVEARQRRDAVLAQLAGCAKADDKPALALAA